VRFLRAAIKCSLQFIIAPAPFVMFIASPTSAEKRAQFIEIHWLHEVLIASGGERSSVVFGLFVAGDCKNQRMGSFPWRRKRILWKRPL
jgi:hypothetical protein